MNPSASGWIEKFHHLYQPHQHSYTDLEGLYKYARQEGFVYGFNFNLLPRFSKRYDLSSEEIAKVNLWYCLYHIHLMHRPADGYKEFTSEALKFYQKAEKNAKSIYKRVLKIINKQARLENLLDDRVLIGHNIFTRNFQNSVTNALLFLDVLTYERHLTQDLEVKDFASKLENMIMNISIDASLIISQGGDSKTAKKYAHLYEGSYFFGSGKSAINRDYRKILHSDFRTTEKKYLLDVGCMICYADLQISEKDELFLNQLAYDIGLDQHLVRESMAQLAEFHSKNKKVGKFFKGSHPIFNFYDHSSDLVIRLIRKNKNRIVQEIRGSKELMRLLIKARNRPLSIAEQKQVEHQLMDILKTIPSLAIFMLPGGAILLPLLARLLPNFLPSSFYENKIDK